jgi:hypothetical protein
MLSIQRVRNESGYALTASDRAHRYLSGGYNLDLTSIFAPLVMKPYVNNVPASVDFNTMLEINQVFEIGAMYRTDQAFGIITDFTINKRLHFGYSH